MTFSEIFVSLIVLVAIFVALLTALRIIGFFLEVPKQLKRIADALEKGE